MNYIKEINAFYDQLEFNPLSSSAVALWYALMHMNNKTGWRGEFSVAGAVLRLKAGLPESTFKRARTELKEKGYIDFTSSKANQAPVYQMSSLLIDFQADHGENRRDMESSANQEDNRGVIYEASEEGNQQPNQPVNQQVSGEVSPLIKQEEIKQKETEGGGAPEVDPFTFYEQNIGVLTPFVTETMTAWCEEMGNELVMESMRLAVRNNKMFFSYCEGILKRWQKRGVRTLEDARALEMEPKSRPGTQTLKEQPDHVQSIFDKLKQEGEA